MEPIDEIDRPEARPPGLRATVIAAVLCAALGLLWVMLGGRSGNQLFDTSLHRACYEGNVDEARRLIAFGADVNAQGDANGRNTPLILAMAAEKNRLALAHLLLDHGANVRLADKHGRTALHVAALYGDLDAARLLLARGADVNARDSEGHTPLSYAGVWTKDRPMRELLAGAGGR